MLTFNQYIQEGVNDPAIFKAVFLAGGPGSGKSFIVGKTGLVGMGYKLINSDSAFERELKKASLEATPETIFTKKGQEIRAKAKQLTNKQMALAIQGRLGLVIDGTGKDYMKIKNQVNSLREIGYDVAMIFVNTDLDTAISRDAQRPRTLGRDIVSKMWKDVQKNLGRFQNEFGRNMYIVDNSEGANYEGASMSIYKRITQWTKEDPKNPKAKKWIETQRKKK